MPKPEFFRQWANYYTNLSCLKRTAAVAFVEGKDDKPFWKKVFAHAGLQVLLFCGLDNAENKATGKQHCLKFLPYLNKRFILCIDSDYDYIKQRRPGYNAQKFVLQTYTYAIENHYLASNSDAQEFLKQYSNIIHNAFLAHLEGEEGAGVFSNLVAPYSPQEAALEELQEQLAQCLPAKKENNYAALGLTADNTYLFIKAKTLKHKLKCGSALTFSHFPMDKMKADIAVIFAKK
jgi:hypothetical protein